MKKFLLFVFLCASAQAQEIRYTVVSQELVEARLKRAPKSNKERAQELSRMFAEAGCAPENITEQKLGMGRVPNIICVLPGESDKVIVIGAHLDKVSAGAGIVDNWSGASLLPSIFEALKREKRSHRFVFIAFSEEEEGLKGSMHYLKKLPKEELLRIHGMVNLDTLGLSPTKVWASKADPQMLQVLANVAKFKSLPLSGMNVDNVGSSDSESFRAKKVPSLTIHSVTNETFKFLHSDDDRLEAIKLADYYATYQLLAAYTAALDQILGREEFKQTAKPAAN